jgi:hypothetical protein
MVGPDPGPGCLRPRGNARWAAGRYGGGRRRRGTHDHGRRWRSPPVAHSAAGSCRHRRGCEQGDGRGCRRRGSVGRRGGGSCGFGHRRPEIRRFDCRRPRLPVAGWGAGNHRDRRRPCDPGSDRHGRARHRDALQVVGSSYGHRRRPHGSGDARRGAGTRDGRRRLGRDPGSGRLRPHRRAPRPRSEPGRDLRWGADGRRGDGRDRSRVSVVGLATTAHRCLDARRHPAPVGQIGSRCPSVGPPRPSDGGRQLPSVAAGCGRRGAGNSRHYRYRSRAASEARRRGGDDG